MRLVIAPESVSGTASATVLTRRWRLATMRKAVSAKRRSHGISGWSLGLWLRRRVRPRTRSAALEQTATRDASGRAFACDAIVVATAHELGEGLLSYDGRFARYARVDAG
ncbi:MAG: hypothetical protein ACYCO3_04960 [Mycobacteriales bacterium]